jgi:hypothetical protein
VGTLPLLALEVPLPLPIPFADAPLLGPLGEALPLFCNAAIELRIPPLVGRGHRPGTAAHTLHSTVRRVCRVEIALARRPQPRPHGVFTLLISRRSAIVFFKI